MGRLGVPDSDLPQVMSCLVTQCSLKLVETASELFKAKPTCSVSVPSSCFLFSQKIMSPASMDEIPSLRSGMTKLNLFLVNNSSLKDLTVARGRGRNSNRVRILLTKKAQENSASFKISFTTPFSSAAKRELKIFEPMLFSSILRKVSFLRIFKGMGLGQ